MLADRRTSAGLIRRAFAVDRLGGEHGVRFQLFDQFVFLVYQQADAFTPRRCACGFHHHVQHLVRLGCHYQVGALPVGVLSGSAGLFLLGHGVARGAAP